MSSVLKQGGLCLETRGTDSLGLAECRGIGANRPQSQVRTLPLGGDCGSYTEREFLFNLHLVIARKYENVLECDVRTQV